MATLGGTHPAYWTLTHEIRWAKLAGEGTASGQQQSLEGNTKVSEGRKAVHLFHLFFRRGSGKGQRGLSGGMNNLRTSDRARSKFTCLGIALNVKLQRGSPRPISWIIVLQTVDPFKSLYCQRERFIKMHRMEFLSWGVWSPIPVPSNKKTLINLIGGRVSVFYVAVDTGSR